MPFKVGETVGSYRVIEQLGQGGMATVFKAYHAALDRYVALKVLHPAFMQDPSFLARFEREAKVVAKLDHPNIVPIYDYSEHEGHPYLVMKYIEGETLKARLAERPLSQEEGLRIISAVGAALSYAHRKDILHRDIKPSNVILSQQGEVYLTDFGLARIATAGESTLSSDMMLGTPQYISPEQAMGVRDLDEGTDIYSFGVLLYQLVVGRVPFSADTPFSIIHDHIYTPLPLPCSVNPNVPEGVERLLLKALAKERKDRFASVDDMVKAFQGVVKGEALSSLWSDPDAPMIAEHLSEPVETLDPPTTLVVGDTSATTEERLDAPQRRWRWWYLLPLILGACLCLAVVLPRLGAEETAEATTTQRSEAATSPEAPLRRTPQPVPPSVEVPADRALEAALEVVEAHPDDPYAHLELAGVYADLAREEEAIAAFTTAAELAGEDAEFFLVAGDMLAARQIWQPALEMYIEAVRLKQGQIAPGLGEKINQAAYYAAESADAGSVLFADTDRGDQQPSLVFPGIESARARYVLLHQSVEQAAEMIRGVLDRKPDFAEARLVHAEVLHHMDNDEEATAILEELAQDGKIPGWVQVQARRLLVEVRQ